MEVPGRRILTRLSPSYRGGRCIREFPQLAPSRTSNTPNAARNSPQDLNTGTFIQREGSLLHRSGLITDDQADCDRLRMAEAGRRFVISARPLERFYPACPDARLILIPPADEFTFTKGIDDSRDVSLHGPAADAIDRARSAVADLGRDDRGRLHESRTSSRAEGGDLFRRRAIHPYRKIGVKLIFYFALGGKGRIVRIDVDGMTLGFGARFQNAIYPGRRHSASSTGRRQCNNRSTN